MTPSITAVRMTGSAHRAELPLLVLGPSLGTSAATLWTAAAAGLTDQFDVLAWDLPGHGHNRSVPEEPFSMAELAAGVRHVVDDVQAQRDDLGAPFAYAGVSVGGCVGLQLLLDVPRRVSSAVLLGTGAKIGDERLWADRIGQVRSSGTTGLVAGVVVRWFASGFADRDPDTVSSLLRALQDADDRGYVRVCQALAGFDVRDRLAEIGVPVLAVAGADDPVTTPEHLGTIATGVGRGELAELADTSHLAPAERPEEVATLIRRHVLGPEQPGSEEDDEPGDGVPARPGLDSRTRSIIALTALVARGHHDDLAVHLRAAVRNGLTRVEIREVLRQTALYCGDADADTASRIADQVLADPED
jgi:3-oxoadipate enol-lactonase/4-carboxymuconolactone decarboxylase